MWNVSCCQYSSVRYNSELYNCINYVLLITITKYLIDRDKLFLYILIFNSCYVRIYCDYYCNERLMRDDIINCLYNLNQLCFAFDN